MHSAKLKEALLARDTLVERCLFAESGHKGNLWTEF